MVGYVLMILLCVSPLIFNFATRKYLNPYKLYLVFGKKGSGKSTYLVKLAKQYLKRKKHWNIYTNMDDLLKAAQHNEYEEHDPVYKTFGDIAREEGFTAVAASFYSIAAIEKTHGDRFGAFAKLMKEGRLFSSEKEESWICLNCGHIYTGCEVPPRCPVCREEQGYFIRLSSLPLS